MLNYNQLKEKRKEFLAATGLYPEEFERLLPVFKEKYSLVRPTDQTKKGKQWYFGMKAHVGVDSKTKLVHSAVATAANVADSTVLPELLHGEETKVWGDQAYRGQTEAIREGAPAAQDMTNKRYRYKDRIDEVERAKNRTKSRVRSKVEHVFGVLKLKFGFVKVRYRGLAKNANRLFAAFALVNLFLVRRKLLAAAV